MIESLKAIYSANNTFLHKSSDSGKGDCVPGGLVSLMHISHGVREVQNIHIKRSGKGLQRGIEK